MSTDDSSPHGPSSALVPSSRPSLAIRVIYMIVFGLVFWILCWTLAIAALAQLVLTALAGRSNPELLRFGVGLASYARQIIEFLTFVSERIPYPFSDWPR
ncbi:MAG TPA: DUF4389 domain-containing protein [Steroidobacteraceae bacterium]|nr:DUF4389 domain-containing protein [Steroidobacteraceae bacterium]